VGYAMSAKMKCALFLPVKGIFLTLLLLLLAGPSQAQDGQITELLVQGNAYADSALIVNTAGLQRGDEISPDKVQQAIRRLYALGLFSDVRVETVPVEDGLRLALVVEEFPALEKLVITGLDKVSHEEITEAIGLGESQIVSPAIIEERGRKIKEFYESKGYLLATVEAQVTEVGEKNRVILTYNVREGQKVQVKKIEILGNRAFGDGSIKKVMETKEKRWWRGGKFEREKYEEDKTKIVDFYQKEGYIDATVVSDSLWYGPSKKHLFIWLTVDEGKRYRVGEIALQGNKLFSDTELRSQFQLKEGDIYNQEKYEETLGNLYTSYQEQGYLYTQILDRRVPQDSLVSISFEIVEGDPARVHKILIAGNTKTKEKVIRRELVIKPGQIFKRSAFLRSHREVYYLNFFGNVLPDYQTLPNGDIDLIFQVEEKPTGQAQVGVGYSERDKLVGTIGLGIPNLFGNGQRLDFTWDFGKVRQNVSIGFTEPWLLDTPTSAGFDLYQSSRRWTNYYTEVRRGGDLRVGRRLSWPDDYFRVYWKYRLEDVEYTEFSRSYNPPAEYDLRLISWPQRTSSTTVTLVRDSRDLPEFATLGSVHSLSSEFAGGILGGDVNYHKHIFDSAWYFQNFWRLTLMLKSRVGIVDTYKSSQSVPFSERFMPGGTSYDGMIRGYDNRSVGPQQNGTEIGGRTMLIFTLEYQFPVVQQQIYGLLFVDAGNAWRSLAETDPTDLKRSAGVGIRIVAPMLGVIGFDLAYGFDNEPRGEWHPHFQLGTSF
jgi:outer membrane protein insertion porin family